MYVFLDLEQILVYATPIFIGLLVVLSELLILNLMSLIFYLTLSFWKVKYITEVARMIHV